MSAEEQLKLVVEQDSPDALRAEVELLRARVAQLTASGHQLISTQPRMQSLLHRATDAIIQFESDGTISSFNSAAERIFDYAEIELLHQRGNQLFNLPDEFRDDVPGFVLEYVRRTANHYDHPLVGRRRDQSSVLLEVSVTEIAAEDLILFDDFTDQENAGDGGYEAFLCILHDITERKQIDEELRRHREEMEQLVAEQVREIRQAKEAFLEGLRAGACYYLTKPFQEDMLLSLVSTAVEDSMRYRRALEESDVASRTSGLLHEAAFSFKSLNSARDLATVLANAFPDPGRVVIGLSELLVNAVEHGNLGISYEEKGQLREQNRWEQEVERRLADAAYRDRRVAVKYQRAADTIRVTITDQGEGFDWQKYLEMDPSRVFDTHGRGIAMSRMISFDHVEYRGSGNEVEVMVRLLDSWNSVKRYRQPSRLRSGRG